MSRWGLPGVRIPGDSEAPRPDRLLGRGSLLLADVGPGDREGWHAHLRSFGPPPALGVADLAAIAEAAGLRGYGGAAFPTAVKLRSVAGGRAPLVIVNASEGEHASAKDGVLLRHVPHLVLDGALITARALGAQGVTVRLAEDRGDLPETVRRAAAERGDGARVTVSVGPAAFAAGEATAVVNGVSGLPALPSPLGRPPRTPSRIKALGRPALVSNVETFARLALLARGRPADSALLTVSGAVGRPGVLELPPYASLGDAVEAAGGTREPVSAVVTGGWHGRWLRWDCDVRAARLTRTGLESVGGRWGAGVVVLLAADLCPLTAVAGVADLLASSSAGQCGPCRAGLPAVAAELATMARPVRGKAVPAVRLPDVVSSLDALRGRGLCAHPSASAAALGSALELFADDVEAHAHGRCVATTARNALLTSRLSA